jgi:septum site-determining protein MinD
LVVWTVANQKGGVGKTTTTANIGMALARLGQSTLLVDADSGLRNLDLLLGLENRIVYTGANILNESCRLEQAIIQDKREEKLSFLPLSSTNVDSSVTEEEIIKIIDLVKKDFEYILIHSPAGIDGGFQTAIECASEAIVVVTPEVPSIRDADRVIGILLSKGIDDINLVINRVRPNMIRADDMMSIDDVTDILGVTLIGIVPDSEKIIVASNRGEPVVLYDKNCPPGIAFDKTAKRLNGEDVDLFNSKGKNPVRRLMGKIFS